MPLAAPERLNNEVGANEKDKTIENTVSHACQRRTVGQHMVEMEIVASALTFNGLKSR